MLTGDGLKLRLSQMLGRPWHEPGANLPQQDQPQAHIAGVVGGTQTLWGERLEDPVCLQPAPWCRDVLEAQG